MATFSFELYPPRTPAAELALHTALDHLIGSGPEFISVTYGANGSSRESSLAVVRRLLAGGISPMAHLTCVGSSYAEATLLIREFLEAGVTNFLALRGDPPAGASETDSFLGDLGSAGELVQLIHRVQAEKDQFAQVPVPGFPDAKRLASGSKVTIAVAAFPHGHPRSRSVSQDLDSLLAKQAAGANLAITQLFFEPDDYLGFVEMARSAGVTMRILPGIMPVLTPTRLARIVDLSGEAMPTGLLRGLENAASPQEQHAVGIRHAVALASEVLDGGAPGLHLYTFNQHEPVLEILAEVGLVNPVSFPSTSSPSTSSPSALFPSTSSPSASKEHA